MVKEAEGAAGAEGAKRAWAGIWGWAKEAKELAERVEKLWVSAFFSFLFFSFFIPACTLIQSTAPWCVLRCYTEHTPKNCHWKEAWRGPLTVSTSQPRRRNFAFSRQSLIHLMSCNGTWSAGMASKECQSFTPMTIKPSSPGFSSIFCFFLFQHIFLPASISWLYFVFLIRAEMSAGI